MTQAMVGILALGLAVIVLLFNVTSTKKLEQTSFILGCTESNNDRAYCEHLYEEWKRARHH